MWSTRNSIYFTHCSASNKVISIIVKTSTVAFGQVVKSELEEQKMLSLIF